MGTAEPVGRAAEMSGETSDHVDVDVLGAGRHVADAQGSAHLLAERGGGDDHERSPFSEIASVDHPWRSPGRVEGNDRASAGSLNYAKRAA